MFWFIAFFISDEDAQTSLWTKENQMANLRFRVFVLVAMIVVAFLSMMAIARYVRNNEKMYNTCMAIYLLFIVSCEFAIFLTIMKMVKVEYGNDFRRKVFVQVGSAKVTEEGIIP